MTPPPLIIDILITTIAIGVPACLYIARPRSKPSAFEYREAANRAAEAHARWKALQDAHDESAPAYRAFVKARSDQIAVEMKCRARPQGWGR